MRILVLLLLGLPAYSQPVMSIMNGGCAITTVPAGGVFTNLTMSSFGAGNATQTANNQFSPACIVSAATLVEASDTGQQHSTIGTATATITAAVHTFSFYVKRGSGTRNVQYQISSSTFASSAGGQVDLAACTFGFTTSGGAYTGVSGTATVAPFGFCYVTVTATLTLDTAVNLIIWLYNSGVTYNGDGTSSLIMWGADFR